MNNDTFLFRRSQLKTVFEALKKQPSTMLMVSVQTGIFRANVCRYVSMLRKHDKIQLLKYGLCKVSNYKAGYYSTDEALFTNLPKQLKLFTNET